MAWNPEALPDLSGRTFAVTGGNAGIGYFACEQLAAAGAHVVLLGRSPERLRTALAALRAQVACAEVSTIPLDLADLDSVGRAAGELVRRGRIDALIENAGVTAPGRVRRTTAQGFELAMGTNHLGHFALTALAMPVLTASAARVVPMGSLITRLRPFDVDDLQSRRSYSDFRSYAQSKHAVQSFGFELDRRLRAAGSPVRSVLAQPGFSLDRRTPDRPGISTRVPAFGLLAPLFQGKDHGAWPAVRAAVDPAAEGGSYFGPARLGAGRPVPGTAPAADRDPDRARRLWTVSEELTGVPFPVGE
ncbi:SDR family NAD(P)-dependent oxidoreductase [Amycolatopsis jiangsuensis]|uniref:NAD(P)-dependent dehydrogenase (Short-subunit alcohol dehydrogenase family) n=1 Tax=Amycolatopsis jiangsuensis TaxID=1181879 RepID=A0A840J4D0_9PSEU|nr:SDR family NAD(P)-dependent oxidoreductase [Amycolatopsis jiangsuensis]MBB4688910.1 NAD(P)-dependent dehydrogenase (short-subunit alcohol dehydrogenase family) [Amycolatopsis jiangsuensis]